MLDSFKRDINYLRVSVTDRCNLRCEYCMPSEGVELFKHEKILKFEEIVEVIKVGVSLGIKKVRLTGGEPLVRPGIIDLVGMISEISEVDDLSMTTNGILLPKFAAELKEAGLQRVNISLDTLDSVKYKKITRGGELIKVLEGIDAARSVGLNPIKINAVIENVQESQEKEDLKEFTKSNGLKLRFINQMNITSGKFSQVIGGSGGDCPNCNRMRLTSTGMLRPCLFSDISYDIKKLGAKEAFLQAIGKKPKCGTSGSSGSFFNIGG